VSLNIEIDQLSRQLRRHEADHIRSVRNANCQICQILRARIQQLTEAEIQALLGPDIQSISGEEVQQLLNGDDGDDE